VVRNSNGCRDSITRTVTAAALLNLDLLYDSLTCPGSVECITNNTVSSLPLTYNWQFAGGVPNTSSSPSPCVVYQDTGTYRYLLTIDVDGQCEVHDTGNFYVYYPQACGRISQDTFFCLTPPPLVQGYNCTTGAISYTWDWGDNITTVTQFDTASHQYNQPGSYIVKLIAYTDDGCIDTTTIDTVFITGPTGSFTFSPTPGVCACEDNVIFDVALVGASNATLFYGCNNGFYSTNVSPVGTVNNPTHLIISAPPYCQLDSCLPLLIFGDATGCIVQYQDNNNLVLVDSPEVRFTYNNIATCDTGAVCFMDSSIYHLQPHQSYTTSRLWDFGDGVTDTSANPCHRFNVSGKYAVTLRVVSNLGCDKIFTDSVIVSGPPIADFNVDDSVVCTPAQVCFSDLSTTDVNSRITRWNWNFGDNTTDNSSNPCHLYTIGGNYLVTLCVTDTFGCTDCDTLIIQVKNSPVANAGNDTILCYGTTGQLQGSGGISCAWTPTPLLSNPAICNPTFQAISDVNFVLTVTDQFGCVGSDSVSITVAQPTASFTFPATNCLNDPTCFTDASTFVNGTAACWNWNFGDNTTGQGTNICHTYSSAASYSVVYSICDDHGCVDDTVVPLNILVRPTALFNVNDSVVCANEQVCVTDASVANGDPITGWLWSFGDGTTSTLQNPPCHNFPIPPASSYRVSLVITSQNGCPDSTSRNIVVNEYPNANFNWTLVCEDELMPLVSTSTPGDGAITSCLWTLYVGASNPQTSNNCNTSFQFPGAGSYDVRLLVTDANGCSDSVTRRVTTDSLSTIFVNPGDTSICLGTSVNYTVTGNFDNITWVPNVWLSNPNGANVVITPQANISYIVSAVNGVCDAASDTVVVRVIQPVPLEIDATPDRIILGLTSNLTSYVPGRIDSIVWSPDNTLDCHDCPNPIARPVETTTYTATIYYGENGTTCINSAQVTITILNSCTGDIVYVPNTFTPNGDGKNDVFMIRGLGLGKVNYFRIFDRWGKLVFEETQAPANDDSFGWNGNDLNGKKLNPAVFVYTYEVECINGDIVTGSGNVTLIR
jgi:gliding motility-associated-like protein